ncbi:hypothetical protein [Elstera cyanobacteriorum]|uniref:hypothetical protein n=1 Tax=Elstera cyanobacteriorum TaxID=2022747 RepID=UPI0023553805|nr:hypothetical protein [Elstera cyanobacteriorum]MCK6442017.1 hypothetical protein [Elstera cyanobacteriorum]
MNSSPAETHAGPAPASIEALVAMLLATRNQAAMIASLEQAQRPIMSKALKDEIKAGIKALGGHIEAKREREATATLLVLLFIDASSVIPRLRRDGVLRASRYGYSGNLISTIAKAALRIRPLMNASPERMRYLESVIALSRLATDARALYDEIVKILRGRRDRVLKTLLAILNSQFYHDWSGDPSDSSPQLEHYSKEEYAEGVSLIFSIYASLFPITDNCCNYVDVDTIQANDKTYERLLVSAMRLIKFKDAETLIDGLPYQATSNGETITIASIDPDIERSVRLGYIQHEKQVIIRAQKMGKFELPMSLREIIEKHCNSETLDTMLDLAESPVRRYRLILPAAPEIFSFFSGNHIFRDEIERQLLLEVDNFGTTDIQIAKVNEQVTTLDIFKLQRYFTFMSCVYQKKLAGVKDEAERLSLSLTSTVLLMPHDSLFAQLMLIFESEDKVHSLINLLKMTISDKHIDLQYRPLIDIGTHYVVAPHLLAASNLVRNTIVANNLRSVALGPTDLMVKELIESFEKAGFRVRGGFELRVAGQDIELDIVAWRDGHLFFFECKNGYHPCSPHEMRNSYDHLKKGRDQLDKRRQIFSDPAHQMELYKRLGWAVEATANVHTGIIIANRVFHGATLNGHPVRQAHELINILSRGKLGGQEHSRLIWAGSEFHADDLVTYLEGDSIATKQLNALEPTNREFAMGRHRRLVFASFFLDQRREQQIIEQSYPVV